MKLRHLIANLTLKRSVFLGCERILPFVNFCSSVLAAKEESSVVEMVKIEENYV